MTKTSDLQLPYGDRRIKYDSEKHIEIHVYLDVCSLSECLRVPNEKLSIW